MIPRDTRICFLLLVCALAPLVSSNMLDLAIQRRQSGALGTGSTGDGAGLSTPVSTPSATPSSTPEPSSTPSSTPQQTSQASSTPSASAPRSSSAAPSSDRSSRSSFAPFTSTNAGGGLVVATTNSNGDPVTFIGAAASAFTAGISTPVTFTTPLVSVQTSQFTTDVVTVSNGQSVTQRLTSQALVTRTTGSAVATANPQLSANGGSNGSSGLSSTNKKIIGGVVGGVGGAIVLGALGIVAWRLWGRKKTSTEDDAYADHYSKSQLTHEKHSSVASSNLNGLERYHDAAHPPPKANTASNF